MRRRQFLGAAAILAATALTGCQGAAAPAGSTSPGATSGGLGSVTLGMSYIPNIQFAPQYVGVDKGLYADRGVSVTLRHHGANEGLFQALASGQEHYLIAGADEMIQARAEGMDLVAIASYYATYPVVVVVPEDSTISSLKDLKGRTVGLPGRYGESWFGLQVALQSAGLSESDVKIQEIGYTQQAALTTKKVDAVVGYANNDVVQFGLAGFATRSLPLAENVPLVSISLITTRAELTGHPERAKAMAQALTASIDAVAADPEGALEISAKAIPGLSADAARKSAKATLDATLKIMTGSDGKAVGKLDPARFAEMVTFMKAKGLITKDVDPATSVDTSAFR